MKLIIAGSRHLRPEPFWLELKILESGISLTEVKEIVSGNANGVDNAGELLAAELGIHVKKFPAQWFKHGKAAGPIRNKQMAKYADVLFLYWDGNSHGSANMRAEMKALGKPVYEVITFTM